MFGKTFRKIISKLYFKYCFRKETFAQEIVFYMIPSRLDKKECSAILTQIESNFNHSEDGDRLPPYRLRPLALGPADDVSVEGEVRMASHHE
jgi:hypothetical protein